MKKESDLTRDLLRKLRLSLGGSVVIKHADQLRFGIPDISVSWARRTSWIEVKRLEGNRWISRGIQDKTMFDLSVQTLALYAVYGEDFTQVQEPSHPRDLKKVLAYSQKRYDHDLIIHVVKDVHLHGRIPPQIESPGRGELL